MYFNILGIKKRIANGNANSLTVKLPAYLAGSSLNKENTIADVHRNATTSGRCMADRIFFCYRKKIIEMNFNKRNR